MKIDNSDKYNPILKIEVDDYLYSLSLSHVDEKCHIWLGEVLERQMNEIHKRACKNTKKQIQKDFCDSLGLSFILKGGAK
jgi:hypothetical protein